MTDARPSWRIGSRRFHTRTCHRSLALDASFPRCRGPQFHVIPDMLGELRRPDPLRLEADIGEAAAYLGFCQHLAHAFREFCNNFGWRVPGREESRPGGDIDERNAPLLHGRDLRET